MNVKVCSKESQEYMNKIWFDAYAGYTSSLVWDMNYAYLNYLHKYPEVRIPPSGSPIPSPIFLMFGPLKLNQNFESCL